MGLKKRGTAQRLRLPAESFKMHHTMCRDPGQVDTQQKTGFQDVKVNGQGQICEKHLF